MASWAGRQTDRKDLESLKNEEARNALDQRQNRGLPAYQQLANNEPPPPASVVRHNISPPEYLVHYEPVRAAITTKSQAVKAIYSSDASFFAQQNIIGTYLETKLRDENNRIQRGQSGPYKRSSPAVQFYNHLMHKLETLSSSIAGSNNKARNNWAEALGPFRRQLFCDLYNDDRIVRAFSRELPHFPDQLPALDEWSLGIKTYSVFSSRNTTITSPPINVRAPLELLRRVRTVLLVDDSGSMAGAGHSNWNADFGVNATRTSYRSNWSPVESRWRQACNILSAVAPIIYQYSPYGIDMHFLNRNTFYTGLRTSDDVRSAFAAGEPHGGTPLGQRVNDILDGYMCTLRYDRSLMPINLLVITDGEAGDREFLHWAIEEHVTKIMHRGYQAHQLGVEFIQVGDCPDALRFLIELEEEVDRHHRNFKRDVVGVTPANRILQMNADSFMAIALSGVDARINGYMRARQVNV